jgi:flagellar hook-length control protein FliK
MVVNFLEKSNNLCNNVRNSESLSSSSESSKEKFLDIFTKEQQANQTKELPQYEKSPANEINQRNNVEKSEDTNQGVDSEQKSSINKSNDSNLNKEVNQEVDKKEGVKDKDKSDVIDNNEINNGSDHKINDNIDEIIINPEVPEEFNLSDEVIQEIAEATNLSDKVIISITEGVIDTISKEELVSIVSSINNSKLLSNEEKVPLLEKIYSNKDNVRNQSVVMSKVVSNNEEVNFVNKCRENKLNNEEKTNLKVSKLNNNNTASTKNDVTTNTSTNISANVTKTNTTTNTTNTDTKEYFANENQRNMSTKVENQQDGQNSAKEKDNQQTENQDVFSKVKIINFKTDKAYEGNDNFANVIENEQDIKVNFEKPIIGNNLNSLQKENVSKQILESIKIVLKDGKSEMSMQLKPDNLGKLSFEVVSEKGIMIAKFTAESYQVKEIIESNLPALKDAMESKGLNVQGFSVSVDDKRERSTSYEQLNTSKRSKILDEDKNIIFTNAYSEELINPYYTGESSINFIA